MDIMDKDDVGRMADDEADDMKSQAAQDDKDAEDKKDLVKKSDIVIISTPHKAYKNLKISKKKVLVDLWGIFEKK